MIPATNSQLLVAEDWTKIYQSFRNADFQSYDFDTLRRTMITYLRETYPEEFNDYIDSSEYIALIDLIAYLGQNLSFRIDLNARENFLETAQRQDSVLRLAQLISYNPKRNIPASGLLKISAISTTDNIFDNNGLNLANQVIGWNDPANANWYQQFVSILNSAMPNGTSFGTPSDSAVVNGVSTDQYQVNSTNVDVPVYTITKPINGIPTTFELSGAAFSGQTYVYETPPKPAESFSYIFQNDNKGAGSANTGFFTYFRQGTLASTRFSINNPVANEIIGINANGINNDDVWLWQLDANGNYKTLWTRVDALVGNNVIYNNIANNTRTLYTVTSRANDQIDLNFADGSFADLPKGNFVLFYRQSNGRTYSITPDQMAGINITIPYVNKSGVAQKLTLTLSLQYTVTNSSGPESLASIKQNAPQTYYLQNRMITGEDYNIAPLSISNDILKISSVNRISSGISKYFELSDISGQYSSTDIFAKDGIIYREEAQPSFDFSFQTANDVYAAINSQLAPIIRSNTFKNWYFSTDFYPRPQLSLLNYQWNKTTVTTAQTTGYFQDQFSGSPVQLGYFSNNNATYITPGAMIKFKAPIENGVQKYFTADGTLTINPDSTTSLFMWDTVINVVGDGSNQGKGNLVTGIGPVVLSGKIPSGAIPVEVIPTLITTLSVAFQAQIAVLCLSQQNFGLSFDKNTRQWFIIVNSNLDMTSPFSLTYQGDTANIQKDASWLILFAWNGSNYTVSYRLLNYIFESANQTAFFVNYDNNNYDYVNGRTIKDQIDVLSVNSLNTSTTALGVDYRWQIESSVVEFDGYVEPKKVVIGFYDANNDGQIDNPDAFNIIVDPNSVNAQTSYNDKFVYFQLSSDGNRYSIVDTSITPVHAYPNEDAAFAAYVSTPSVEPLSADTLYYFYQPDVIKNFDPTSRTFVLNTGYFAKSGRANIKFHYQHNTGEERRLDPSKTNIIDIYILTNSYDSAFRSYLSGATATLPLAPTSSSLEENFANALEPIKSISDTIVYRPASYKVLFGSKADPNLQATFKAVSNPGVVTSTNDLTTRILAAINSFFSIDNWTFGQSFNFGELATYVLNTMTPDIVNFVIVPKNASLPFGSLYEISCQSNEILISGAQATDIEIIDALTAASINSTSPIITNTNGTVY